jgi:branched-chain amino acid transport system ATP-binding protein
VGRTFQIVKPFRGMTVRENVAIGLLYGRHGLRRMSEAASAADEVLDQVGLAGKAAVTPGELTVVEARRLEFAKALALRPRLLLLDEVMAGLIPTEVDEIVAVIRGIRAAGVTVLLIEHVMRAVMNLSDDVYVLNHGRIIAHGAPGEIAANPEVIEAYLGHGAVHA